MKKLWYLLKDKILFAVATILSLIMIKVAIKNRLWTASSNKDKIIESSNKIDDSLNKSNDALNKIDIIVNKTVENIDNTHTSVSTSKSERDKIADDIFKRK